MSELTNVFTDIADAIRSKTGSSATMTPAQMATAIGGISTGIEKVKLTQNEYDALPLADKTNPKKLYMIDERNYLYKWDFTKSLVDEIQGKEVILKNGLTRNNQGLIFNQATQIATLGEISLDGKTIEIDVPSFDCKANASYHMRFLTNTNNPSDNGTGALIYRNKSKYNQWGAFGYTENAYSVCTWSHYGLTGENALDNKTVKIIFNQNQNTELYLNDTYIGTSEVYFVPSLTKYVEIGGVSSSSKASSGDQCYDMTISGVRIYENED